MDGGQRLRGCGRDQGRSELETGPSAPAMRLALRMSDSARYIAGVAGYLRPAWISPFVESSHARPSREARALIRLGHVESSLLDCGKTCTNGSRASSTLLKVRSRSTPCMDVGHNAITSPCGCRHERTDHP
ncbi:MAG: hypothetical protein DI592_11225 [Stenotrophomonas maltophilia]|nr:MAG: hypothetical protein DI592_11225 [Stenotrophomonas maltophilia]